MPIRGEIWGAINKFDKPLAGQQEFDMRSTTVVDTFHRAGIKTYETKIEPTEQLYAVILRREKDTPTLPDSSTKPLSRFRCYIFSGPFSEIPFSLEFLGNPQPSTTPSIDYFTIEMFPIFTCKNEEISLKLSKAQPGTIVKVSFGNKSNLSEPTITETTNFPPLKPDNPRTTIDKFNDNITNVVSGSMSSRPLVKTQEEIKIQEKTSIAAANGQSLTIEWPLPQDRTRPDRNHPTANYGKRLYSSGRIGTHRGVDIAARLNTDLYASDDGRVLQSGWNTTSAYYGISIIIEHRKNNVTFYTLYAHLNKAFVSVGQKVKRGQKIGETGSTGNSSGPHLHYELRIKNNSRGSAFDPYPHFEKAPE